MDGGIDIEEFFEAVAGHIMSLGTDDFEDKDFCGQVVGDLMRLQVFNLKGEEHLQVVGRNSTELAEQLVLACFHNISVEHLGALHLKPLNRPLNARKSCEEPT